MFLSRRRGHEAVQEEENISSASLSSAPSIIVTTIHHLIRQKAKSDGQHPVVVPDRFDYFFPANQPRRERKTFFVSENGKKMNIAPN
jgi:hypothetical protein